MKYRSDQADGPSPDDLLLAIVHDMRAHLRASLTNSQLLQRSAIASLPAEARDQLNRIAAANKDLDRLLSRISDFAGASHLGSGKPITLNMALQAALLQFPARPVEIGPVAQSAAHQRIPQEYVRVFVELIDNALKFSANQPIRVEVTSNGETSSTFVRIIDAGIGIDPGEVEGAFHPLTRLNARDRFPGAGLGLPICRRIAAVVGATVNLVPSPSGGTIATVVIHSNV